MSPLTLETCSMLFSYILRDCFLLESMLITCAVFHGFKIWFIRCCCSSQSRLVTGGSVLTETINKPQTLICVFVWSHFRSEGNQVSCEPLNRWRSSDRRKHRLSACFSQLTCAFLSDLSSLLQSDHRYPWDPALNRKRRPILSDSCSRTSSSDSCRCISDCLGKNMQWFCDTMGKMFCFLKWNASIRCTLGVQNEPDPNWK